jgi:hypothetical protein
MIGELPEDLEITPIVKNDALKILELVQVLTVQLIFLSPKVEFRLMKKCNQDYCSH